MKTDKKLYYQTMNDRSKYNGMKSVLMKKYGQCQICGSKEQLHIHHKDGRGSTVPRNERNNKLSNLMLVCNSCHNKHFKHKAGKKKKCLICRQEFICEKNNNQKHCTICKVRTDLINQRVWHREYYRKHLSKAAQLKKVNEYNAI